MTTVIDPAESLRGYLSAHQDFDPPHSILDLRHPDTHVCVGNWAEGYSLWWTDSVASDWLEWYPALSVALARVAALLHCVSRRGTLLRPLHGRQPSTHASPSAVFAGHRRRLQRQLEERLHRAGGCDSDFALLPGLHR